MVSCARHRRKEKVTPDAFILAASLLKPGCPVQKGFFAKTLRRFGITSSLLHHHHVEVLVHINSQARTQDASVPRRT